MRTRWASYGGTPVSPALRVDVEGHLADKISVGAVPLSLFRQVRPQYFPAATFLLGAYTSAVAAPGATSWNWLQNVRSAAGP